MARRGAFNLPHVGGSGHHAALADALVACIQVVARQTDGENLSALARLESYPSRFYRHAESGRACANGDAIFIFATRGTVARFSTTRSRPRILAHTSCFGERANGRAVFALAQRILNESTNDGTLALLLRRFARRLRIADPIMGGVCATRIV